MCKCNMNTTSFNILHQNQISNLPVPQFNHNIVIYKTTPQINLRNHKKNKCTEISPQILKIIRRNCENKSDQERSQIKISCLFLYINKTSLVSYFLTISFPTTLFSNVAQFEIPHEPNYFQSNVHHNQFSNMITY